MKRIKYLMLFLAVFVTLPFNAFAMSTLEYELNARKEGESSLWLPIYTSQIEEGEIFDIYDVAKFNTKSNTLSFVNNGSLSYFSNDNDDDKYIITDYDNTISSLQLRHGGKTYIGGRGKLKIGKSDYVYYNYYANVRVEKDGYNKFLNDENGNMYHTEDLGRALDNVDLDSTDFRSKAESIIEAEWSNLQKWNSDLIGDISFDPSYVFITKNSSTFESEEKYVTEELVKTYIKTNLDITYLDDGVLFDGSKVLEDDGIVFRGEEVFPDNYILNAEDIYDEKADSVDTTELENKMIISLYDLTVTQGNTKVNIDSGKYTVKLPITDDMKDYTDFNVVYVKDGKVVEEIDSTFVDNKYVEFETTHLSEYGVVGKPLEQKTSITADITNVDFGTIKKEFTQEQADAILKTVRITNTGNTTITIDNTNPSNSGPFGCYWFDNTEKIAPGKYIDVQLRLADSSAFATIPGNYTGTYTFTATNAYDNNDKVTLDITAKVNVITDEYVKGDMNQNGKVDLQDIIILLKKYLGTLTTTDEDKTIGDMDNNGSIGLKDIILLLRTYLGSN